MPQSLRVAVIGLGYGRQHAAYRALPGVEVACLCDADEARLEAATPARPPPSTPYIAGPQSGESKPTSIGIDKPL